MEANENSENNQIVREDSPDFPREFPPRPYKILDFHGKKRVGIVARGLENLMEIAHVKLNIPPETPVRVALELDGTEVDEEDYFNTLEENTALVILVGDQKWLPDYPSTSYRHDQPDGAEKPPPPHLVKLVDQLYSDLTCVTLLGGKDLDELNQIDMECFADILPEEDRAYLMNVKEAGIRIRAEKDQAKEALQLLKLYHARHIAARNQEKKSE